MNQEARPSYVQPLKAGYFCFCSHQGYHHNHYLLSCTVCCIVSCIPNDNERGQKFDIF